LAHDLDLIAAQVFGGAVGNEGMGLLGFGVDWANITSSPFYLPLSTQISQYFGWGMNYWLLCVCPCIIGSSVLTRLNFSPLIYYSNTWNSKSVARFAGFAGCVLILVSLQELPFHLAELVQPRRLRL
jgi:predicted MFS family arabinose efflux permease